MALFDNLNFDPKNLKTIQEKAPDIQNQMAEAQKMLASIEVEGAAGTENYSVKITINGRHEAVRVVIDPQLLTQPIQVLSDLVASAITDASHKAEVEIQTKMFGFLKNMKMPG